MQARPKPGTMPVRALRGAARKALAERPAWRARGGVAGGTLLQCSEASLPRGAPKGGHHGAMSGLPAGYQRPAANMDHTRAGGAHQLRARTPARRPVRTKIDHDPKRGTAETKFAHFLCSEGEPNETTERRIQRFAVARERSAQELSGARRRAQRARHALARLFEAGARHA
ncbi:hypothetical protein PUN4_600136 [Paraburkholderia unamae]|nr:hypothetical protein PUN4_600136 [Paraburkholderia unamae]